jgi:hypothetical protein
MITWNIPKLNNQLPNPAKVKDNAKARRSVKRAQASQRPPDTAPERIKVRCDARTIITIRPHMLDFWRTRYPNLTILP